MLINNIYMGKNFTKRDKKQKIHKTKASIESLSTVSPSLKTIEFVLSYSKSTKSILDNKFLVSLN